MSLKLILIFVSCLSLSYGLFPFSNRSDTVTSNEAGGYEDGPNVPVPFYRYFDRSTGDHFYTTDPSHVQKEKRSYIFEKAVGKLYKEAKSGTVALFRYYNVNTFHHFYTTNWTELEGSDHLDRDYIYQGISGFVFDHPQEDTIPLYRYLNGGNGDYFYSTSLTDLRIPGYKLQSIQAYIYPVTYSEFSVDVERLIVDETIELKWNSMSKNFALDVNELIAENLANLKMEFANLQKLFHQLKNNPVPIGFIYVQLPNQPEPSAIWPMVSWIEVTMNYAGLFFRVLGGNSEDFGVVQSDNAPRITEAETKNSYNAFTGKISLPVGGTSELLYSSQFGTRNQFEGTRYTTSGGEVRPINQAVKLWKRSG